MELKPTKYIVVNYSFTIFPIHKEITRAKFNFYCIYIFGDLFVLPRLLHAIESSC